MIHTVVNTLFNGIDTRDVAWLLVLILAITHPALQWAWNLFGRRGPTQK